MNPFNRFKVQNQLGQGSFSKHAPITGQALSTKRSTAWMAHRSLLRWRSQTKTGRC